MVEPIVWLGAGAAAFFLLKPEEKKEKTPEQKSEEIAQDVIDQVEEKILEEIGEVPVEEVLEEEEQEEDLSEDDPYLEDVNEDGIVNVKDIVATVNSQIQNFNETQDESIGSAEAGELDDAQRSLYDQLWKSQRDCIQLYEDREIDEKTEQVYILLEQNKGWKVKTKPLQEGSTIIRKFFCPPGKEPLQW